MKVEVSRRKFLQGSVALTIAGGTSITATNLFSSSEEKRMIEATTKTGTGDAKEIATLCEMCVNKCAALARVEGGVVTKLNPNPMFQNLKTCYVLVKMRGCKLFMTPIV